MIDRLARIQELIKREISVILQENIDEVLISEVTVTYVIVTKDLGMAKVYYVISEEEIDPAKVNSLLKKYAKYIRRELSQRVYLKYVPTLSFREDNLENERRKVDMLFDKISAEKNDEYSANKEKEGLDG